MSLWTRLFCYCTSRGGCLTRSCYPLVLCSNQARLDARTDDAKMDFPFLFGTSRYPIRSPMLWGLYRLSNEILGGVHPENPLKAPQKALNLRHLMGGKPLVPKRKVKFNFAWSSVLIATRRALFPPIFILNPSTSPHHRKTRITDYHSIVICSILHNMPAYSSSSISTSSPITRAI